MSIHAMLSVALKVPEIALDQTEAAQLAAAIAGVERHYNVGFSEKSADWVNLFMVIGAVYGTRVMAYRMRTSQRH
jgi:hypothetical protein